MILFNSNHVVRSRIMNIIARPQRKQEFEKPVTMTFWLSEVKNLTNIPQLHELLIMSCFDSLHFINFLVCLISFELLYLSLFSLENSQQHELRVLESK